MCSMIPRDADHDAQSSGDDDHSIEEPESAPRDTAIAELVSAAERTPSRAHETVARGRVYLLLLNVALLFVFVALTAFNWLFPVHRHSPEPPSVTPSPSASAIIVTVTVSGAGTTASPTSLSGATDTPTATSAPSVSAPTPTAIAPTATPTRAPTPTVTPTPCVLCG